MSKRMKFLEGVGPVVVTFVRAKLRRDREGGRDAGMGFELPLTLEVLKALPRSILESYAAMDKPGGPVSSEFDLKLQGRSLLFRIAPDVKESVLFRHGLTLAKIALEKVEKGSGHDINLNFQVDMALDQETTDFLGQCFGNQIYLEVEETQPELMPVGAESEEGE